MTIRSATPYLVVRGRAREAIALYARALGAVTESMQRFGDVDAHCPEARKDLVMHASLRVGEALVLLSDGPHASEPSREPPSCSVALDFDDEAQLRRAFRSLSVNGTPVMSPFAAPWGALFAAVVDEFGVSWMLNAHAPASRG